MTALNFLIQFIGFFMQTIPVCLLGSISFDEESLKLSRKKTIALFVIPDILFSLGFAVWENLMQSIEYRQLKSIANIYMSVFIIIMFSLFFRFIKAPKLNKMIVLLILTHYAAILFTINAIILASLDIYGGGHIYSGYDLLSTPILTCATFPLVYLFILKIVRPAMSLSDNKAMRRGFIYSCAAFLLFCAAVMFFDFSFVRQTLRDIRVLVFFCAFILTDCILYYMFFSETRLVAQNNQLENRIQSLNEQYHRINRGIEESRRLKHDMRHHLNAIGSMAKGGEIKEIIEYLEAYSGVYGELDNISLSGYHAIDNILRYYLSLAKEKKITLKTEFHKLRSDMDFDVTDITIMIGNLMENAIEACEGLPEDERLIIITVRQSDALLLIKEENSCRRDLDAKSSFTGWESFVSTKHTKHPGQGLKSISLVAEKYGGSAEFKCESGTFTARLVLNIP